MTAQRALGIGFALALVVIAAGCADGYQAALRIPSPPPFTVTAVSFRRLPYYTSSTFQTQAAHTDTSCDSSEDGTIQDTGDGTGTYNGTGTTNCESTTTPAQYSTITWAHVFNYVLVRGAGYRYSIECEANVRWSKCASLQPGERFQALIRGGVMWVTGTENGKTAHIKYNILGQQPD